MAALAAALDSAVRSLTPRSTIYIPQIGLPPRLDQPPRTACATRVHRPPGVIRHRIVACLYEPGHPDVPSPSRPELRNSAIRLHFLTPAYSRPRRAAAARSLHWL